MTGSARPLRVLHVIPTLDASAGGPPVAVVGWARGLAAVGDVPRIVTTSLAGPAAWRSPSVATREAIRFPRGFETVRIAVARAGEPRRLAYARSLAGLLDELIPTVDIVHLHMLYLYPTFIAARLASELRVPYVISPHGALDPWILRRGRIQKWVTDLLWQRSALDRARALIVATAEEGRLLAPLRLRAPVAVVPLGLDLSLFTCAASSHAADAAGADGVPVILNHGRLAPKKSLHLLVDALPAVLARHPRARVRIVGPDPEGIGAGLAARAEQLGIGPHVEIAGAVYGAALAREVAAATIWALPSATENFGIAVVEAMAAGAPVLISREVNLAEAAEDAGACRVVPRDARGLAGAISGLLDDPAARARLAREGPLFAARFGEAEAAAALHDVYAAVIDGRRIGG